MILKLEAKNFLSWKSLNFSFSEGITLIDGWNHDDQSSEGSGKSAILNALAWGLFGKIPKSDVRVDDVIKQGEESCRVEIFLKHKDIQSIVRTRNPNDIFLKLNNGEVVKGTKAVETQQIIENIIELSFDTFCQTIYFSQNYPKKFVTASQEERFKILSEIQNLQIFDKAYKNTHELHKKEFSKEIELKNKINNTANEINNKKELLKQAENFLAQKNNNKEIQRTQINYEIGVKQNLLKELNSNLEKLEDKLIQHNQEETHEKVKQVKALLQERKDLLNELKNQEKVIKNSILNKNSLLLEIEDLQAKLNNLNLKIEELVKFLQNPVTECPTCGKDGYEHNTEESIKELDRLDKLKTNYIKSLTVKENEINILDSLDSGELSKSIEELQNEISEINTDYEELIELKHSLFFTEKEVSNLKKQIFNEENQLNLLIQKLELLDKKDDSQKTLDDISNYTKLIISLNTDLESLKLEHINLCTYMDRLVTLKNGFKEVKIFTFNSLLNDLNNKVNKLLLELFEVPIKVKFINSEKTIELEIYHDNQRKSYGLLSGGESTRVSLAIDLALSEIVFERTSNKFNLRILDEYFKYLSEISMEKCLNLIQKLKGSTILIEHNSIFRSIIDNTFFVEKINGTSSVKEIS